MFKYKLNIKQIIHTDAANSSNLLSDCMCVSTLNV